MLMVKYYNIYKIPQIKQTDWWLDKIKTYIIIVDMIDKI